MLKRRDKGLGAFTVQIFLHDFAAYTGHGTGFEGIKKVNVEIFENAV